jgi:hypothetical protein
MVLKINLTKGRQVAKNSAIYLFFNVLRSELQKLKSRIICNCPKPGQLKYEEVNVSHVTIFVSSRVKTEGLH